MWRKTAGVALTVACWAAAAAAVHACPICFQTEDAQAANGVRAAVVVLGGVTAGVLGAVLAFARRLARRDRP